MSTERILIRVRNLDFGGIISAALPDFCVCFQTFGRQVPTISMLVLPHPLAVLNYEAAKSIEITAF